MTEAFRFKLLKPNRISEGFFSDYPGLIGVVNDAEIRNITPMYNIRGDCLFVKADSHEEAVIIIGDLNRQYQSLAHDLPRLQYEAFQKSEQRTEFRKF